MYLQRNVNGRFNNQNKSCCNDCDKNILDIPTNERFYYTNRVQPMNGILENLLGHENTPITTVGLALETKTIIMLAGAVVVAGLIIKNVKIK